MDGPVLLLERPVATMTPMSMGALQQEIEQNDEKHQEGHKRHRARLDAHDDRLEAIEQAQADFYLKLQAVSGKEVTIRDIVWPTGLVASIFVAGLTTALTIAGAIWATNSGLRSDVRDILTQQAASSRMADERAATQKESLADAKRLQELQRIQLESLTKTVLTMQRR